MFSDRYVVRVDDRLEFNMYVVPGVMLSVALFQNPQRKTLHFNLSPQIKTHFWGDFDGRQVDSHISNW